VAESCQFAPTPIGHGFVLEEAQAEFAMLTVTGGGGGVLDEEEPPQPTKMSRPNKIIAREKKAKNCGLDFDKAHRRVEDLQKH
jgi:hypothetical protein